MKRLLAILLAMVLTIGFIAPQNGAVFAEEEIPVVEIVEEAPEEAVQPANEPEEAPAEEEPAEEPAAEEPAEDLAEEEPASEEPVPEEPTEEEPDEEPAAEDPAEEAPAINPNLPVSQNPSFYSGYVMIIRDTALFTAKTGAKAELKAEKAVYAYAAKRVNIGTSKERVFAAINTGSEVLECYISVNDVRPLSNEEVEKY